MRWDIGAVTVYCFVNIAVVDCKRCLKNEELGWRQENMYWCEDVRYPLCCEKDREFTCCELKTSTILREQLQLWGMVLVFVGATALVYLYKTRDSSSCCTCSACATFRNSFDTIFGSATGDIFHLPNVTNQPPDAQSDLRGLRPRNAPVPSTTLRHISDYRPPPRHRQP